MTAFSEEIETEFKEMAFVLEYAERGCWILAVYNQADAREQIINRLKSELKIPVFTWHYSEDKPYPIDYLQDLSEQQKQQRAVVSFINTTDGGDKTIKSLDFNREKFAHYPHSLIFWVTENERGDIARKAGHFWAQRRGTFDFSKLALTQSQQNHSHGIGSWLNNLLNIDNYSEALQQLDFYQQLLTEYSPVAQVNFTHEISVAETTDKISYLLYYLGRYSEAIDFCEQALSLYQTLLGENAYPTLAASNNLAFLYFLSGDLTKGKSLLQRILSVLEQGVDYMPAMATILNNLAELYRSQGNYAEAEPLYQRSLTIRETALGEDHHDVAASLNNLAGLYSNQGNYVKAEALYLKSLVILEKSLGTNHPEIATSLNNLAEIYRVQGKYAEAEPLYQRSLAIFEATLSKDHPDVAASLNNLALLYDKQGKFVEAEILYQKSLDIREAALGKKHPDVAPSLNNLAGLYDKQGKYAEAELLYKRSLVIRETALGKDHPDVATSLNNLAALYYAQGKYAEAEPLYQRAVTIAENSLGKKHPNTKTIRENYNRLLANRKKRQKPKPSSKSTKKKKR